MDAAEGGRPAIREKGLETAADVALALLDVFEPVGGGFARTRQPVALGQHQEDRQASDVGAQAAVTLHPAEKTIELGEFGVDFFRRGGGVHGHHQGVGVQHLTAERAAGGGRFPDQGVGDAAVAVEHHGGSRLVFALFGGFIGEGIGDDFLVGGIGAVFVDAAAEVGEVGRGVGEKAAEQVRLHLGGLAERPEQRRLAGAGRAEQYQAQGFVGHGSPGRGRVMSGGASVRPRHQTGDGQVLIQIRPVETDAASTDLVMPPLLRGCLQQRAEPRQWHGEFARPSTSPASCPRRSPLPWPAPRLARRSAAGWACRPSFFSDYASKNSFQASDNPSTWASTNCSI